MPGPCLASTTADSEPTARRPLVRQALAHGVKGPFETRPTDAAVPDMVGTCMRLILRPSFGSEPRSVLKDAGPQILVPFLDEQKRSAARHGNSSFRGRSRLQRREPVGGDDGATCSPPR